MRTYPSSCRAAVCRHCGKALSLSKAPDGAPLCEDCAALLQIQSEFGLLPAGPDPQLRQHLQAMEDRRRAFQRDCILRTVLAAALF